MKRGMILIYGGVCYGIFLVSFLALAAFVVGIGPWTLDGPAATVAADRKTFATDLFVNGLLIGVFALQHSVMARRPFKRFLTRWIPEPAERSSYVLASSLAVLLLVGNWRPMGGTVWDIRDPGGRIVLSALGAAGWLTVLWTTFLINHYDLFGLRQVWLAFRNRPYTPLPFSTPGPYRLVRHPLYVGWLMAFWMTPTLTLGHLAFAGGMTLYILAAIPWEERDLLRTHAAYAGYRRRVPKLFPRLNGTSAADRHTAVAPEHSDSTTSARPVSLKG